VQNIFQDVQVFDESCVFRDFSFLNEMILTGMEM